MSDNRSGCVANVGALNWLSFGLREPYVCAKQQERPELSKPNGPQTSTNIQRTKINA